MSKKYKYQEFPIGNMIFKKNKAAMNGLLTIEDANLFMNVVKCNGFASCLGC